MKILIVTEYFYPQSAGGTELYVYNLAKVLQKQQHEVNILSVSHSAQKHVLYKGLNITYIPFNKDLRTVVINGEELADNLSDFITTVKQIHPNLVHFHTLTTSISANHITTVKQAGFKTVLTSHIPSHTCIRGDLMRMGKSICDGKVEEQKCLSCYLQYRGIQEPVNYFLALGLRLIRFPKNIANVVRRKQKELKQLQRSLDRLVVVSNWQQVIFAKNGFKDRQLSLCRQAVDISKSSKPKKINTHKLIIGFVGRITAVKGLHVLLSALKNIPANQFELRIAAISTEAEIEYYYDQKLQAELLPQTTWIENLPNEKIGGFLQELDVLCVPSQWLETGPFVVYEALAQGIPVLGSDLGGIAELISEGKNGWLFPFNDEKYLRFQITFLVKQKLAGKLLKDIEPVIRPIEKLAEEMLEIYEQL